MAEAAQEKKPPFFKASYKGLEFDWFDLDGTVGRRLAEHEYPQRDVPLIEDLGRMKRPFSIAAVIIGDDWKERLEKLLGVIEEPGAGLLVHPVFGEVKVYPRPCKWSLSVGAYRRVDIALEFVEAGELAFPRPTVNTGKKVEAVAAKAKEPVKSKFAATMDTIKAGQVKVAALASNLQARLAPLQQAVGDGIAMARAAQDFARAVVDLPGSLMDSVLGMLEDVRSEVMSIADMTSLLDLRGYASRLQLLTGGGRSGSGGGDDGTPTQVAEQAVVDLVVGAVLIDTALAVAELPVLLPGSAPSVGAEDGDVVLAPALDVQVSVPRTEADIPVAEDVIAARDAISEALWEMAASVDLEEFVVWQDLRHAVHVHMTAVASSGQRLREYTPPVVMPALVAAYRVHGDALRAGELCERNRVRHPLFVPVKALKVPV